MLGDRINTVLARAGVCCAAGFIAGCGGGSGSAAVATVDPGAVTTANFGATFSPASLDATSIEGNTGRMAFTAALTYTGSSGVYLVAEGDRDVLLAVDGTVSGNTLLGSVTLRGDVAPGPHPAELRLHACTDPRCTAEVAGSPVVLPISYVVKPNLQVQQQVLLHRAGREAAPVVVLPVTVPPEAGTVQMRSNGPPNAFDVTFDGSAVQVITHQVRAGDYTLNVILQGSSDPRYVRTVDVRYTVDAPADGERALSVAPGSVGLFVPQGTTTTQRLLVTRPTWTDSWEPPQIVSGADMLRLRDLGGDQYEIAVDASSAALGGYSGMLRFAAGTAGGTQYVPVTTQVVSAFYPTGSFTLALNSRSTVADLKISSPIVTADGVPARWTAASRAPWLRVLRANGQTGIDLLELEIDPAFGGASERGLAAMLDLSIDRPGTTAMPIQVSVWNDLPNLQISQAVLTGDKGRIYVDGALDSSGSTLLAAGALQVDGANLRSARFVQDPRMVGDVSVLALDVDGAVAGHPIVIRAQTPLVTSQVTVAVEPPTRVPRGYLPLPYGAYRAPQYAPSLDALYFSGMGTVYRWAHGTTGWNLSQVAVPGLSDIALRQDEQRLYAVSGTAIRGLDPVSLALATGGELQNRLYGPVTSFDAAAPSGMRGLVFASDGRAIASLVTTDSGQRLTRGAYWVAAASGTRTLADLTASPQQGDPGSGYWSAEQLQAGVGLVASANGHAIVGTDPSGYVAIYRPEQRVWTDGPVVPAGVTIVAVSDSGERVVRSDGMVLGSGNPLGSLTSVVPFSHVAGGFGLTQDGRYGLVYGYRVATESGAERARDATLWIVDMASIPATPLASAPVVATLPLDDAVGCTTALVGGETCRHSASVTLAPGGASAFVLGPRGLAAVPLPASVDVKPASAGTTRVPAAAQSPSKSQSFRVLGIVRAAR